MMRAALPTILTGLMSFACAGSSPAPEPAPMPVAPIADAATASPAEPGKLSFRVMAQDGSGKRAIKAGDTLHSGDKIAMGVTVNQDLHVYVMQFFPDNSAAILYPSAGEDNLVSGNVRLPPTGWFQLDDVIGEENVYVIASTRPLQDADKQVLAIVDQVQTSGSAMGAENAASDDESGAQSLEVEGDNDPSSASESTKPEAIAKKPKGKRATKVKAVGSGAQGAEAAKPGRATLQTRGISRVEDDGTGPLVHIETDETGVAIAVFQFQHAKAK